MEIPPGSPFSPLPAAASLGGRERGLEPTEEIAKALLFHDSLFIRTGLATKSRAHSHKNMILQRGRFCWLRGCIWWKILYGSFSLFFFFISLCCNFSFFVIMDFCFIFYKTLALKDSNTIQTAPPIPTPGAPAELGIPLAFLIFFFLIFIFCGCFPLSLPWPLVLEGRWRGVLGQVEFV